MIDILIRAYNESIWLPQLFRSLQKQKGNIIRNILLLDNNSIDFPERYIDQFPELSIIYKKYKKNYLPGEMLNYGISILMNLLDKKNISSDYLCTISAHCFFYENDSLLKLYDHINKIPKCRSGFGRQVPMNISDAQAIRDLVLLYSKENRLISKSPAFNNAYSFIRYDALKENLFDKKATNLEDVIWANNEIKKGFKIAYCGESEIVHYHGPHHSNSFKRLDQTKNIIKNNSKIFNINLRTAKIIKSDIISVFAGEYLNKTLINEAKRQTKNNTIILWTKSDHKNDFSNEEFKNIFWIKRKLIIEENKTIYSELPTLYHYLFSKSKLHNFYILYDNSIDNRYKIINPHSAIKIITENFGNVIWPTIKSNKIIFTIDGEGNKHSNQQLNESGFIKENQVEVLRGNGTIISSAALIHPYLMFKKPNFEFID